MEPSGGLYPTIMSLPHPVLQRLAGIMDGAAVHNWRTLVERLPEYTQTDAILFATEEQLGRSPTMAVLRELDSRGWSVVDLAQLAHQARLGIVVDIIKTHCKAQGWSLPLPPPSSLHSAKECRQRPSSPPQPTPPTTPTALREAQDRYCPLPASFSDDAYSVSYETLKSATNGFSSLSLTEGGHKIGEGGSGDVFYCKLATASSSEEKEIAVKVLRKDPESSLGQTQFMTEMQALSKLHHPYLLPVLGFSCDGPRQCILYPYLSQGPLLHHLPHLPTHRRLRVAGQVAEALHYLHTGLTQVFIHRDVKSANILLAEDWTAALGDFGILRVQPSTGTMVTTTVAGTREYMDPDYLRGGVVSEKTDIYSFGVVLFELLLGAPAAGPLSIRGNTEHTDIITFVEGYEEEVEPILIGQWPDDVGQTVWCLAERCIDERSLRPTSEEILLKLTSLQSHS